MSLSGIIYWALYLVLVIITFGTFHFLITDLEPTYRSLNMLALFYVLLSYFIYAAITPLFFMKLARVSYGMGWVYMCLSTIVAGFLIWLGFGDGDYSPEFYEYEFVTAGIWFGFVNTVAMGFIRFRKSFREKHNTKTG